LTYPHLGASFEQTSKNCRAPIVMPSPTTILFVDDEPRVLAGLKRALRARREEWNMRFESDPETALAFARDVAPDVAVLDIRMPKISGLDLAREIKTANPSSVCIILSGSTDFDVAVASINEGHVFRYYVKPCPADELVAGIEAALASRGRRRSDRPEQGLLNDRNDAERLTSEAVNMLPYGIVIVGSDDRALFTNEAAAVIIAEGCGFGLGADGRCVGANPNETRNLRLAIAGAREGAVPTALTLGSLEESPLRVTVEPYPDTESPDDRLVCLFLTHDSPKDAPPARMLADMFGLTVSESHLAAALAKGLSLEEAATECGITKSSARTYLKGVFAKVGVSRQAELVRKLVLSIRR
jgi:DNA-binding NarL/FixJ family response regulator